MSLIDQMTPRQKIAAIAVVGAVVMAVIVIGTQMRTHRALTEFPEPQGTDSIIRKPSTAGEMTVDVSGAVNRPGVYKLKADARVMDAIQSAGGFQQGADIRKINQAALLTDGMKIDVPWVEEASNPGSNDDPPANFLVSINLAGPDELVMLPGVGPAIADNIVQYREENGPFQTLDAVQEVPGIGPNLFDRIKPYLSL
ncbi:MAG: ComEA family DNA-binding protein [Armatimonadetes bacterium]|nr:ComEA family DNA-binding protein [Armatimonadota bacterium]